MLIFVCSVVSGVSSVTGRGYADSFLPHSSSQSGGNCKLPFCTKNLPKFYKPENPDFSMTIVMIPADPFDKFPGEWYSDIRVSPKDMNDHIKERCT